MVCATARHQFEFDHLTAMDAKRELVVKLHRENFKPCEILRKLKQLNLSRLFIYRAIKRFKETGTHRIKPKLGNKKSVRVKSVIKRVRERIRRNPAQSGNQLSKEMKISRRSMGRILHDDLGLKAYKKQKIQGLTEVQKKARVEKCKDLLAWHAGDDIIFSDEKMFQLQDSHNQQNDRVYGVSLKDIPIDKLAVERFQNVSAVMVWGAISPRGKLPLLFIDRGVKINQDYYIQHVMQNHLLVHARNLYGNDYYCFQQDSAPSHKAARAQDWCRVNLVDFIPWKEWPSSSPDLNPLDFSIWGYMLSKIGSTKGLTLESFKRRLVTIWDEIPDEVVRAACNSFFERMRKVIKANGERFEIMN